MSLALVWLPLAAANAAHQAHQATGAVLATFGDDCGGPEAPADHGEHAGECHNAVGPQAFLAPQDQTLAHQWIVMVGGIPAAAPLPHAAAAGLFRPPRGSHRA